MSLKMALVGDKRKTVEDVVSVRNVLDCNVSGTIGLPKDLKHDMFY